MNSQENLKPGLPRRARKKQEMEEKILRAAFSLFKLKGFEETTLEEICERADVSRTALFNYFRTKDALLLELSQRAAAEVSGTLEQRRSQLGGTRELIQEFFILLAKKIRVYSGAFEKVVSRMACFPLPPGWGEMLARLLAEGRERGEIRKDLDLQVMAEMVATVGFQSILTWQRQQPRRPLAGILRNRMSLLWEGIQGSCGGASGQE